MSTQDMDILAHKIVSLEKRHNALARAQQLPNSSVRLVDGDDVGLAESAEATKDIGDEAAYLGDWLTDADNNLDDNVEYGVEVPEWIQEAGHAGDVAFEFGLVVSDQVDEAQTKANQAAADALQAAIDAAAAQSKAQEALDAALLAVVSSVIEYAVGVSDTVPPSSGWSTDNPTPSEGEFVWMRTVVTYADESTAISTPVLMSRGGEAVTIESIQSFYCRVLPPYDIPDLPTTAEPPSPPWLSSPPVYTSGALLVVTDRILYSDGTFSYMELRTDPTWAAAGAATLEAQDAMFLAEGLYQTIPSVTAPTTSPTGALKQGDQWWKIGAAGTPEEGKFVGVAVWNGSTWQDRQMVADSLLVPGSVGAVLIDDGAITAPKLSVDALDFKTGRGMNIFGAYIEGGRFNLADLGNEEVVWEHDCETLTDVYPYGPAAVTLSTITDSGTRSIQVAGDGGFEIPNTPVPVNSSSSLTLRIWSNKPDFFVFMAGIAASPSGSNIGIFEQFTDFTPNTWEEVSIPVVGPIVQANLIALGASYSDAILRISHIKITNHDLVPSGLSITRDLQGQALLQTSSGNYRTRLVGGELAFDQPGSPGAASIRMNSAGMEIFGSSDYTVTGPLAANTSYVFQNNQTRFEGEVFFKDDTSGPVNVMGTPTTGHSIGTEGFKYQIRSGWVILNGDINGDFTVGTRTIWSGIADWLCPAEPNLVWGSAYVGTYESISFARPDGTIGIRTPTGYTASRVRFTITYPLKR